MVEQAEGRVVGGGVLAQADDRGGKRRVGGRTAVGGYPHWPQNRVVGPLIGQLSNREFIAHVDHLLQGQSRSVAVWVRPERKRAPAVAERPW